MKKKYSALVLAAAMALLTIGCGSPASPTYLGPVDKPAIDGDAEVAPEQEPAEVAPEAEVDVVEEAVDNLPPQCVIGEYKCSGDAAFDKCLANASGVAQWVHIPCPAGTKCELSSTAAICVVPPVDGDMNEADPEPEAEETPAEHEPEVEAEAEAEPEPEPEVEETQESEPEAEPEVDHAECTNGQKACQGNLVKTCMGGHWTETANCGLIGQVCTNGVCQAVNNCYGLEVEAGGENTCVAHDAGTTDLYSFEGDGFEWFATFAGTCSTSCDTTPIACKGVKWDGTKWVSWVAVGCNHLPQGGKGCAWDGRCLDECTDSSQCDEGDAGTVDLCVDYLCQYNPAPACDDADPCTFNDHWVNNVCVGTLYDCGTGWHCETRYNGAQCIADTPPSCDDSNLCTTDTWTGTQCSYTWKTCNSGLSCNQSTGLCEPVVCHGVKAWYGDLNKIAAMDYCKGYDAAGAAHFITRPTQPAAVVGAYGDCTVLCYNARGETIPPDYCGSEWVNGGDRDVPFCWTPACNSLPDHDPAEHQAGCTWDRTCGLGYEVLQCSTDLPYDNPQ